MLVTFATRADAIESLATRMAAKVRAAVAATGSASLVVSGGESPRGLFRVLRGFELPWAHVTFVPSDERWVPLDDAASNEGMIRRELLQGGASAARLVSLYRAGKAPAQATASSSRRITALQPFDFVVLGMGPDGHTASLFPASPDIDSALRSQRQLVVQQVPGLREPRVSLTVKALLAAREIAVLVFGEAKRAVIEQALRPGAAAEYPIRAILHQTSVPVTVYWAP